jgi:DNA-binding NarL/FixJ family response regulator
LVAALKQVLKGRMVVSAFLAERLSDALSKDHPTIQTHQTLSSREFDVLRKLAQGQSLREIAHQLTLSVKTVSTYRARLLDKLHLKTTADLIRHALDHHLVL